MDDTPDPKPAAPEERETRPARTPDGRRHVRPETAPRTPGQIFTDWASI